MTIEELINTLKMYPKDYKVKGKIFYKEKGNFLYPYFGDDLMCKNDKSNIKYGEKSVNIIDWDGDGRSDE